MDFDFDAPRRRYRSRSRSGKTWRGRHRHLFAWVVLGGAAIVLSLVVLAVLAALGLGGLISSAYFGLAEAVLPATWHDELHSIPGILHVVLGIALIAVVAGIAGELFD